VSTVDEEKTTYVAVIVGVLMAVLLILGVAIFFVLTRHRHHKGFLSSLVSKKASGGHGHLKAPSFAASYGVVKDFEHKSYLVSGIPGVAPGTPHGKAMANGGTLLPSATINGDMPHLLDSKNNYYHEPFQGLKYAPFYSYSSVVMEMRNELRKCGGTPNTLSGKLSLLIYSYEQRKKYRNIFQKSIF